MLAKKRGEESYISLNKLNTTKILVTTYSDTLNFRGVIFRTIKYEKLPFPTLFNRPFGQLLKTLHHLKETTQT